MRIALALALLTTAAVGCGVSGAAPLALSWRFADGRRCDDAGTFTVSLRSGATVLGDFPCASGLPPNAAMLAEVALGADVDALGLSALGDQLYRGTLRPDGLPTAMVTLYATGAR